MRLRQYRLVHHTAARCRVWHRPNDFATLIGKRRDPCKVMSYIAHVIKVVTFFSIYMCTDFSYAAAIPAWLWVIALCALAFGQHLNYLVYEKLGTDGVYYGVRFGKTIPWVHDYPYSAMRDPQVRASV